MSKVVGVNLIGFRGVGKSSAGRAAAKELGWDFIDADLALEQSLGESILSFVEKGSEAEFRKRELAWLEQFYHHPPLKPYILALGGGVVEIPAARDLLRPYKSLYIFAPENLLWERLQREPERLKIGQLESQAAFSQRLRHREPFYHELASYKIPNDRDFEHLVAAIVNWIKVEFCRGSR